MTTATEYVVRLRTPHAKQAAFVTSKAKRKMARCGRRGGKTEGAVIIAVQYFLAGGRVLYATPTQEQVDAFWNGCKRALAEPIAAGVYYKNETLHLIERSGTEQRIRAKTAWDPDSLRGDYASLLILDEYQLMAETAWSEVGAPMLLDRDGSAVFLFTPPSVVSRAKSKSKDPLHARRMFRHAQGDHAICRHGPLSETELIELRDRWATFHWTSKDNPVITDEALADVTADMTALAIRQEILAEDIDEVPGSLIKREHIHYGEPPHAKDEKGKDLGWDLVRVVVAIDPAVTATATSDETGIIVAARGSDGKAYVLADRSIRASPDAWARRAVAAYHEFEADEIVAESNNGGEMVRLTIRTVDPNVPVKLVQASRGKQTRAEPVAALYEQGRVIHWQAFPDLEDQWCGWVPGVGNSPDRLDADVWAIGSLGVAGHMSWDSVIQGINPNWKPKAAP